MDTKRLNQIEAHLLQEETLCFQPGIYDEGDLGYVDPAMVPELVEQCRRAIRIRAYFLRQPKEVWAHYKAALEYKE